MGAPAPEKPNEDSTAARRTRIWLRPSLWVVAAFTFSRVGYWLLGVEFDITPLGYLWQLADPVLLREDLAGTLLHLHAQPPLFNLGIGLALQLPPGWATPAFATTHLALGLAMALALYRLLARLGVAQAIAAAIAAVFTVSPPCVLYENFLFYTYPLTALLVFAALALHAWVEDGRMRWLACFFGLVGTIALTYGLFHLAWLFGVAVLLVALCRTHWRQIVFAAALPVVLTTAWYTKNAVMFDTFSASSWMGMSLAKVSLYQIGSEDLKRLAADGEISNIATLPPFNDLAAYRNLDPSWPLPPPTGVPLLDAPTKTNGAPNLHHLAYVDLSRQYLRDSFAVVRSHPSALAQGLWKSLYFYFLPSANYLFLEPNRSRMEGLVRLFDRMVSGQPFPRPLLEPEGASFAVGPERWLTLGFFLVLALPFLFGYGIVAARRAFRPPVDRPRAVLLLFLLTTIAWVSVVGNLLEVGENNRFRFMIDPYYLVFLGLVVEAARRRWLGKRSRVLAGGGA